MKEFFNNRIHQDYFGFYRFYKKLPGVLFIIHLAFAFLFPIIDVAAINNYWYYGIFFMDSAFLALLVEWLLFGVYAFISYFVTSVVISACIVRTDAIKELCKIQKQQYELIFNMSEAANQRKGDNSQAV